MANILGTSSSLSNMAQSIFSNHGSALLNTILIVSTIGGQSVIRKLTFSCPCAYPLNVFHSAVFMFGPSVAIFLVGVLLNSITWKLVHGVCFRASDCRHSWKTSIVSWIEVLVQASVAPAAWLFVVFLDGGYYRCLRADEFCHVESAVQCKNSSILEFYQSSANYLHISKGGTVCPPCICELNGYDGSFLEAESQIIAWFLLVAFGSATLLVMCCTRMCDKYTLVQREYVEAYKDVEDVKFNMVAKEHAAELAEKNARAFFTQKDWTKKDWDWVAGVAEINNPMFARLRIIAAEKTRTTLYTPLQLWNEHKGYRILQPENKMLDETTGEVMQTHEKEATDNESYRITNTIATD